MGYQVQIYKETLSCTTGFDQVGNIINIEPTLKTGDPLNGDFVTGFVDGVATVCDISFLGESIILTFNLSKSYSFLL